MKPFYSIQELARLLDESIYSIADGLVACGITMINGGEKADLSKWQRPITDHGNGQITVRTGFAIVPSPSTVFVATEGLPALWAQSINKALLLDDEDGDGIEKQKSLSVEHGNSDTQEISGAPIPTDRAHVSPQLAILNQAAYKHWANADRDDRGTHPKNSAVTAWLVEHGYSQKLANSAATIIRPPWVPTGRKPEE